MINQETITLELQIILSIVTSASECMNVILSVIMDKCNFKCDSYKG